MLRRWWKKKWAEWVADTILYADPLTAGRHPMQVYLLILCLISGTAQLLGQTEPRSLEENLEPWVVAVWSYTLVLGAFGALLGVYWPGQRDTALTYERGGLAFTGVAAVIYGGILLYSTGLVGAVAGGVTIGFGIACWIRARGIGKIFKRALDGTGGR